jgi:hypothetical protein
MCSSVSKGFFCLACVLVVVIGFLGGKRCESRLFHSCYSSQCVGGPFPGTLSDCVTPVCQDCTANNPLGFVTYCHGVSYPASCTDTGVTTACTAQCQAGGQTCYLCYFVCQ